MEIRVLEYFLAIAREQSISKAAESLNLTQPTLSTQIKALEEELGKTLLIRGTKGSRKVVLTEDGKILRKRAEEILDLVRKTENEISLSSLTVAGDVYIGMGETDSIRFFAKCAKEIQKTYPDIHYHISSGNSQFVLDALDKGLIDFGLIYSNVDLSKYDVLKIKEKEVWGVLMKKDDPLSYKKAIENRDLEGKNIIVSRQEISNKMLTSWMGNKKAKVVATYNLVLNASIMTDEDFGYTICFDRLIENPNLTFRPLFPPLYSEAVIVYKKYQVFSKAAEIFLEKLKEEIVEK